MFEPPDLVLVVHAASPLRAVHGTGRAGEIGIVVPVVGVAIHVVPHAPEIVVGGVGGVVHGADLNIVGVNGVVHVEENEVVLLRVIPPGMIVDVAAVPAGVQHGFRRVAEILHRRIGPLHAGRAHHEDLFGIQRSQSVGIAVVGAPAVQSALVAAAVGMAVKPDLVDDPFVNVFHDPGAFVGVEIHVVESEAGVPGRLDAFFARVVIGLGSEAVAADVARPGVQYHVGHEGDLHHAVGSLEPPVGLVLGHAEARGPAENGVHSPTPGDLGHVCHPGIVGDDRHLKVEIADRKSFQSGNGQRQNENNVPKKFHSSPENKIILQL